MNQLLKEYADKLESDSDQLLEQLAVELFSEYYDRRAGVASKGLATATFLGAILPGGLIGLPIYLHFWNAEREWKILYKQYKENPSKELKAKLIMLKKILKLEDKKIKRAYDKMTPVQKRQLNKEKAKWAQEVKQRDNIR